MRALAFVAIDHNGSIYLIRRPETGLFGGMMQPPLTPLRKNFPPARNALSEAPFRGEWKLKREVVRHTLTHIELEIRQAAAQFFGPPEWRRNLVVATRIQNCCASHGHAQDARPCIGR